MSEGVLLIISALICADCDHIRPRVKFSFEGDVLGEPLLLITILVLLAFVVFIVLLFVYN